MAQEVAGGAWGSIIGSQFIGELRRSSPLHDIGKVGIPDAILLKPGPLSTKEMDRKDAKIAKPVFSVP